MGQRPGGAKIRPGANEEEKNRHKVYIRTNIPAYTSIPMGRDMPPVARGTSGGKRGRGTHKLGGLLNG